VTKLQIIVGSTREGRAAEPVAKWVAKRAEAHGGFDVEVLDLRDWPLPMFAETFATIGDRNDPTYSDPIVKAWNAKIREGDAYLFITPEYNHSISGVLKNAIDNVFVSFAFRNKVAAFVGYSGGPVGGARAVEHLAHIMIEVEVVPLKQSVLVGGVGGAFGADGEPTNPISDIALGITLDDLAWWSAALEPARAAGMLRPGVGRIRAAMEALAEQ
jgi:NAD(P)H-dependent FMN reductase